MLPPGECDARSGVSGRGPVALLVLTAGVVDGPGGWASGWVGELCSTGSRRHAICAAGVAPFPVVLGGRTVRGSG